MTVVASLFIIAGLWWGWRIIYSLLIYNVVDIDVAGLKVLITWKNLIYFTLPLLTLMVGIGLLIWF